MSFSRSSALFKQLPTYSPTHFLHKSSYLFSTTSSSRADFETWDNIQPLSRDDRYLPSQSPTKLTNTKKRDVIIIGGGHNGLTSAAYLSKAGLDVLVLERRHKIGGAAVTEEIFPGYKFSRAAYLAGLLRPQIIQELELQSKYNLSFIKRNPYSFTPTLMNDSLYHGKYLMFWNENESQKTNDSISQFSISDVENFKKFEKYLNGIRKCIQPLLDNECPNIQQIFNVRSTSGGSIHKSIKSVQQFYNLFSNIGSTADVFNFLELLTSPASKILDKFFDSEIMKTTIATDAVIGTTLSPNDTGSAYILLHHVMGEIEGEKGIWAYVRGGMGAVSDALKSCAMDHGTDIVCNADVQQILLSNSNSKCNVTGVRMNDGQIIECKYILCNTNPHHTFVDLLSDVKSDDRHKEFVSEVQRVNYECGAFKINLIVNKLPDFECLPNVMHPSTGLAVVGPQHCGTVHFESRMTDLDRAAQQAKNGIPADRPIIEMTIPSALDHTLITYEPDRKKGHHIVQLFIQYAPYDLNYSQLGVKSWDDLNGAFKQEFVDRVFKIIDEFIPDFSASIIGYDALSPRDLERIFGLYKGNIFHGSLSLDQIAYARPVKEMMGGYKTYIDGLFMCGSGTHPGGGVMGAPGRNCAMVLLDECKLKKKR